MELAAVILVMDCYAILDFPLFRERSRHSNYTTRGICPHPHLFACARKSNLD